MDAKNTIDLKSKNESASVKDIQIESSKEVTPEQYNEKDNEPLSPVNTNNMESQGLKGDHKSPDEISNDKVDSKETYKNDLTLNSDDKLSPDESIVTDDVSLESSVQSELDKEDKNDVSCDGHDKVEEKNDDEITKDSHEDNKIIATEVSARHSESSLYSADDGSNDHGSDLTMALEEADSSSLADVVTDDSREQSVQLPGEIPATREVHHLVKWRRRQQMKKQKQKQRKSSEGERFLFDLMGLEITFLLLNNFKIILVLSVHFYLFKIFPRHKIYSKVK
jgi:hypothetical protein